MSFALATSLFGIDCFEERSLCSLVGVEGERERERELCVALCIDWSFFVLFVFSV